MKRMKQRASADSRGFTLVELMVYTVVSAIAIGAIFSVMVNQSRHFRGQLETRDVRETLRSATALLGTDLRQLSASRGDLYALAANSLTVRSIVGGGLICGVHSSQPRYGLWRPGGVVEGQAEDSVMFNDPATGWAMVPLKSASGSGLANCDWSAGYTPTVVVEVDSLAFTPPVGSPLLVFRRVEYGIFQWNNRWWLGQKVGSASEYEVLTGPLRSPTLGGLTFKYYDAAGAVTADPAQVAEVQLVLRSESQRKRPNRRRTAQGDLTEATFATDSVVTKVFLRN
jgi:type II secretory pathway pseudopilin PulG